MVGRAEEGEWMFLDETEFTVVTGQVFLLNDALTVDDVAAFFERHGLAGGARRDARSMGPILFVNVLMDVESGEPVRWREHQPGGFGLDAFAEDEFAPLIASELDATVLWGDVVTTADGTSEPLADDDRRFDLGIERLVWVTRTSMEDLGGVVAGRLGVPVVEAPAGRGTIMVPTSRRDAFLTEELWGGADGLCLWTTGARRGFAVKRRRKSFVYTWDSAVRRLEPATSGRTMSDGRTTLTEILDSVMAEDTEFREESAALGLSGEAAEALRILLRRDRSDEATFARLVELAGLPAAVAAVADGTLDALDLPGARLREPQTLRQSVAGVFREALDTGATGETSAPSPSRSPLDGWQRLTAKRPLWYTLLTIAIVGGSAALATARLADGQGLGSVWVRLVVMGLWIGSYVAPRGRFIAEDRSTVDDPPARRESPPIRQESDGA
jgi:hypothetical protein